MADDVDTLVAELRTIVDLDATAALTRLNRKHREMCAFSRCYQATTSIGVTVADDATYALPDRVVEVLEVYVDGAPYGKANRRDAYAYSQGRLSFDGDGLWIGSEDSDITLVPTPTEAGLALTVFGALIPPDLAAAGAAATIKIDLDFFDALVDGAAATELRRIGEGDWQSMEAMFTTAKEEQRRRVQRRFHGPGPAQIRVEGYTA